MGRIFEKAILFLLYKTLFVSTHPIRASAREQPRHRISIEPWNRTVSSDAWPPPRADFHSTGYPTDRWTKRSRISGTPNVSSPSIRPTLSRRGPIPFGGCPGRTRGHLCSSLQLRSTFSLVPPSFAWIPCRSCRISRHPSAIAYVYPRTRWRCSPDASKFVALRAR